MGVDRGSFPLSMHDKLINNRLPHERLALTSPESFACQVWVFSGRWTSYHLPNLIRNDSDALVLKRGKGDCLQRFFLLENTRCASHTSISGN